MSATLNITDLNELYSSVTPEEAIAIANLGAQCWLTCKQGLYDQWSASMSEEDTQKALAWKQEGRLAAIESLKSQLVEAEEAMMRAIKAEGQLSALKAAMEDEKATMESEMTQRVEKALESRLKDLEIEKLREMAEKQKELGELQQRLAAFSSQGQMLEMLQEANTLLTTSIAEREERLAEKDAKLQGLIEAQKPKSSYAIGKHGEAVIMELLQKFVIPSFMHASAFDVTGKGHVADIHLVLQSPVGKMMKILVEAKQYSRPVKTKEIGKLHNDVDADDEALAGIMISITSQIASVKQFQIEKTSKGKYILYLALEGFDDEFRGVMICWAIRVLSTLASYSAEMGDDLVGKLVDFFGELEKSVVEADMVVKNCQKATESAITMKRNLSKRLEEFRKENLKTHIAIPSAAGSVDHAKSKKTTQKKSQKSHVISTPSPPVFESSESSDDNDGYVERATEEQPVAEESVEFVEESRPAKGKKLPATGLTGKQRSARKYYEANRERLLEYKRGLREQKQTYED